MDKITDLKDSQTQKNLLEALKGECLASIKYLYYSSKAKKDGFVQISEVFEKTSHNEKEHAKIWFKLLFGEIKDTKDNLLDCIKNENYEYTSMYPEFARIAQEEGFSEISRLFKGVAEIESYHRNRFQKLYDNIVEDKVFKKDKVELWECSNCGFSTITQKAPEICPVCKHKQEYFFIRDDKF